MTIKILKNELRYCGFCKKELKYQMRIYKTNVEGLKEVEYCVFCNDGCKKKRKILEDKVKLVGFLPDIHPARDEVPTSFNRLRGASQLG